MPKFSHLPLSTSGPIECQLSGAELLNDPVFNKGTSFPPDERRTFNLTGLLPAAVHTLEQQAKRAWHQYLSRPDDLARNTFLTSMKEQNEVLYYKVRAGLHFLESAIF
jgi:malate dehydrogenase (oxaloacetate-decarboxylating)